MLELLQILRLMMDDDGSHMGAWGILPLQSDWRLAVTTYLIMRANVRTITSA